MSSVHELRKAVADFFSVAENDVGTSFSLRGRQDSIARAALDSVIRQRVGRVARSVYAAKTYGEIEAELFPDAKGPAIEPNNKPDNVPTPSAASPDPTFGAIQCGIDVELADKMPEANDYWELPFYSNNFAPAEIAYCLRQEKPALHLAARWCAKEALKKCDAAFLTEDMNHLELVASESSAPYLVHHFNGHQRRLPHAVSIAHAGATAVAVVVNMRTSGAVPASTVTETEAAALAPPPIQPAHSSMSPGYGRTVLLCLITSAAALGFSILAFLHN